MFASGRNIDRLSWKLGISIAVLVVGTFAAGGYLLYRNYYDHLLELAQDNARRDTRLIRQALEYQMLDKEEDRSLLRRMSAAFASQPTVHRLMILDREGRVQYSSDPDVDKHQFSSRSETCRVCHREPAKHRMRSTVLELEQGTTLRCVQPIKNRPACHGCHEPAHQINGVIIVDVSLRAAHARLAKSVQKFVFAGGGFALLLLAGIGFALRRLVMRRLYRFEAAARAIANGEHDQRVPVEGHDELSCVEREFNQMADSVTSLLRDLRQQQASLQRVMNSVDDGMVVLDPQRRIVAANEAFVRRFPRRPEELGGRECWRSETGDRQEAILGCQFGDCDECPAQRCFTTGAVQTAICRRTLVDGSERQEEVRASPVISDDDHITHVVEVWRDISDRRSAEARLADYQRMVSLGMLASGFSHELNTPLASIGTCLDGVRRCCNVDTEPETATKREIREYVQIAATQVSRCGAITEQFLRLATGKSLSREILDLQSLVKTTTSLCEHVARRSEVQLTVSEIEPPPVVLANSSAVQQVLLNLLYNAIEVTPPGKAVHVSCRCGDQIELLVRDQGKGIEPEDLGHIFVPFVTRRSGGTGLGLFVSLNLARAWAGDIRVTSTPGEGAQFAVVFPLPNGREEDDDGAS